jgi:hypothetical protein
MHQDAGSALAYYSIADEPAVDDELDLLAGDEELEFCTNCGAELVEFDADPFALHCPVCERRYR